MLVKSHRTRSDLNVRLTTKAKGVYSCYAAIVNHATPGNAQAQMSALDVVVPIIHVGHLIFAAAISPSAPPSPSNLTHTVISTRLRALLSKVDRPQLAPLTGPYAERGHDGRAYRLESPPEEVRGNRVRV